MRTISSWIKKTLFFIPYPAVPNSEPQKSVSWPSGLGSWVQMRPLAGSSHICCCCSFTLVLSVCHVCVSPPLPNEVMKCLFLPGTCSLDEKECSRAHSSLHCFRAFISVCHPEHFFTSSWYTVVSTLSLSRRPISLESPWPQIFSFNSYILADCDR